MSEVQSPATPMNAIWRFLQQSPQSVFDLKSITAVAGREAVDALLRERILVPARVEHSPLADQSAPGLRRPGSSLEVFAFDMLQLGTMLQRAFRLSGGSALFPGVGHPRGMFLLGTSTTGGRVTEVFFAPQPLHEDLIWFLPARRHLRAYTLILVPTEAGMPDALSPQHHHDAGEHVEVCFLEDCVSLRDGQLVVSSESSPAPIAHPLKPFCACFENGIRRNLSQSQYHAMIGAAAAYGLLIDGTMTVTGGLYRGYASHNGQSREAELSAGEFSVAFKLMTSGRALRPDELRSGRLTMPTRSVERMRTKIDVELGYRHWRAFRTLAADSSRDKRYFFNPPPGFKYAILVPFGSQPCPEGDVATVGPDGECQPH